MCLHSFFPNLAIDALILTGQRLTCPRPAFPLTSTAMKASLVLLTAVSAVSAHATWQEFWVGTQDEAGTCVRTVQDNSPIVSVTDATMACGRGPKSTTGVCTVAGE